MLSQPHIESLERRALLSDTPITATLDGNSSSPGEYSYDGVNTNPAHSTWGSANTNLLRLTSPAYGSDPDALAGAGRPGPRVVSNLVDDQGDEDLPNDRDLSAWIYAWGQFVDHDLDRTPPDTSDPAPIAVPAGDPYFDPGSTGKQAIPFSRAQYDPKSGTGAKNPRQYPNTVTAYLDGSAVYGSDASRAAALRTFRNGLMKTSAGNLFPFNTRHLPNDNDTHVFPDDQLFLAGDVRVNENIELSSVQTLFVREHNRLAGLLAAAHPRWSDEQLYQAARRLVISEIQDITYDEYVPALMGDNALPAYKGYRAGVNPGVSVEFSEAAFRFAHSQLGDDVEFLDNAGNPVREEVDFGDAFTNPPLVTENGIDPILKYLASNNAQEVDTKVEGEFRNALFGEPGEGGLDLIAADIQRGRDVGLPDYNTARRAYGLPAVSSFSQITRDRAVQRQLQQAYGSVNNVDLLIGGLAEDHLPGSSLGPTLQRILVDQFTRTRDGDPLWSQTIPDVQLQANTLAEVIRLNTGITNLQDDVFFFSTGTISGHVFTDANRNGRRDPGEAAVRGVTLQLLDVTGKRVALTTAAPDGTYHFDDLPPGLVYQVQIVTRDPLTTPSRRAVTLADTDAAGQFDVDFGLSPRR